jgi:ferrous iron transport protein A
VAAAEPALHELALNEAASVLAVAAPAHAPEWAGWLAEIGFIPGEPVHLLARAAPGGDPLVVRVGDSTFALRLAEAACVRVKRVGKDVSAVSDVGAVRAVPPVRTEHTARVD